MHNNYIVIVCGGCKICVSKIWFNKTRFMNVGFPTVHFIHFRPVYMLS